MKMLQVKMTQLDESKISRSTTVARNLGHDSHVTHKNPHYTFQY